MWRSSVIPESSIPAPWRRELQGFATKLFMNQLVDKCARVRQHTRDGNGVRKHLDRHTTARYGLCWLERGPCCGGLYSGASRLASTAVFDAVSCKLVFSWLVELTLAPR